MSAERGLVLGADIGGTKTALALAPLAPGSAPTHAQRMASPDWPTFTGLVEAFLASAGRPRLAAVAIAAAGPVEAGAVQVTHLPWRIESAGLAQALGVPHVALLNDLVATALGMLELPEQAFARLQGSSLRAPGTLAVLAAGTGLGEALVVFDEQGYARALPSEGGHAAFAPRTARERALLAHLAAGDAHVPVEEAVSGPGLARIHAFVRGEHAPSLDPAAITAAALRGDDAACVEALALFLGCFGSHAGDLALRALADGGVWLGGGIAPQLIESLRSGPFLEAFRAKGRFRDWLAALPVAVCLSPDAALQGALREARALAGAR